jgi:hypothetical protein
MTAPIARDEKCEPLTETGEAKASPETGVTTKVQAGWAQPVVPDVPDAPEGPAARSAIANSIAPATREARPPNSKRRCRMAIRFIVSPAIDI